MVILVHKTVILRPVCDVRHMFFWQSSGVQKKHDEQNLKVLLRIIITSESVSSVRIM